jgi:hypothetical protein
MNGIRRWLAPPLTLTLALALALSMMPGADADAQQGSLTGGRPAQAGSNAYLQRQLRTLERSGASPGSAEILLRRAQRDVISQGRGLYLTPEQARIQRDLDRVGRDLARPQRDARTSQPPALPRGERLPGTIDDDAVLPSFGGTVTLGRLVGRAESAMAEGRPGQARSDIATARSLVDAVDPSSQQDSRALQDLQARMSAVEQRLASGG